MSLQKIHSTWPNWCLTLTNLWGIYAAYVCFQDGRYPLLCIWLVISACMSMLFHSCEQHKHPALPGLWHVTKNQESLYLTLDRVAAVIVGIYVTKLVGLKYMLMQPYVYIALTFNLISELEYLKLITYDNPRVSSFMYYTFHSLWHLTVYSIPIVIVMQTAQAY